MLAQRQNARPAAHPYAFSGTVDEVDWSVQLADASVFGVQIVADVDTMKADFRTIPC